MKEYKGSPEHIKNALNAQVKALEKLQELKKQRIDNYNKNPTLCKTCSNPIEYGKRNVNKFCNSSCAASFNNSGRIQTEETKLKISKSVNHSKRESQVCPPNSSVIIKCKQCQNMFQVKYSSVIKFFAHINVIMIIKKVQNIENI